jgi:hypothetical protein
MTVRLDYSINNDALYLVMYNKDDRGTRWFIAGPDGVTVQRGEQPPETVKHSVTTVILMELLDTLLAAGYRPTSNAWSAGHVSDLKKHIEFAERMATALLPKSENNNG